MTISNDDGYQQATAALYRVNRLRRRAEEDSRETVTLAELDEALTGPSTTAHADPNGLVWLEHRRTRHPVMRYTQESAEAIKAWLDSETPDGDDPLYEEHVDEQGVPYMVIFTEHGEAEMRLEDSLTRDMAGGFYILQPHIRQWHFEQGPE